VRDRRALPTSERTIKRRRRFSLEEKHTMLKAAGEPGATVSEISRQYRSWPPELTRRAFHTLSATADAEYRKRPKDQSRHESLLKPLSLHDGQDHRIGYCAPVVEIVGEEDFYATSRLTIQGDGSSTVHKGAIGRLQLISPAGRWQIR